MARRASLITAGLILGLGSGPAPAQTYTSYSDLGPRLLGVEEDHPAIAKRHDLGLSVQNRHIWAVCISDNVGTEEDEAEFKYISTMHGDEILGVELCLRLIDELTDDYGVDPRITTLVDEVEIWIVPLMNPDGYDRTPRTRYNAHGVDLNRDFPDPFTSPDPSPIGREPETAAIMNWSFGRSFTLAANIHGGGLVVNYPFDTNPSGASVYTPTPDDDLFIWTSEEYSRHNPPMWASPVFFHGITNGADWYTINGGMQDWSYRYVGCNEVTLELGNDKQPPPSQIPTYWNDNRESMLSYLETSLVGVRGIVTEAATGLPVTAAVTVAGREHEVYTDPDVGDYHRMLVPGAHDLTVRAEGFDSHTDRVVVSAGPATRWDVPLRPPPTITYPNGGEQLSAAVPVDVTWADGAPTARFHVQYTGNYGEVDVLNDGFERSMLGDDYDTGGDAAWFLTTAMSHGGTSSARAGDIDNDEVTWMTRAAGGGELSFWYRVSSEPSYDFFSFYVDGERLIHVAGSRPWTEYSSTLPAGTHELRWEYRKDVSASSGSDTAWIDDVIISAEVTQWTDVVTLSDPGATSASWVPLIAGTQYKTRVRAFYETGYFGQWDESDAVFSVVEPTATGDYDGDGDVDLADFATFELCFGAAALGPCGDAFEFVTDGVIDIGDYAGFASRLDGPS